MALAAAHARLGDLPARLRTAIKRDGSVQEQANLTSFEILALAAARQRSAIPAAATWLAAKQNGDGGFSFAARGDPSDVDDTAAAIEALVVAHAPIAAEGRAARFLSANENRDGGFPLEPGGASDSQSTAWVVQALVALHRQGDARRWRYLHARTTAAGLVDYAAGNGADTGLGDRRGARGAGGAASGLTPRPRRAPHMVPAPWSSGSPQSRPRTSAVWRSFQMWSSASRRWASRSSSRRARASAAMIPDSLYEEAGARIVDADAAWGAPLVVKVSPPTTAEIARLKDGATIIAFLNPLGGAETLDALAAAGVTAFAMESIPRISRAQSMDALSSQANVAGYRVGAARRRAHRALLPDADDGRGHDPAVSGARPRRGRRGSPGARHRAAARRADDRLRRPSRGRRAGSLARRRPGLTSASKPPARAATRAS